MVDFVIPEFVADPPIARYGGQWQRDTIARQWLMLVDFTETTDHQLTSEQLVRRLAALLRVQEKAVDDILEEALFRSWLKRQLLCFDSVPHEIEARLRFVRLGNVTHRFLRRHSVRLSYAPILVDDPGYAIAWLSGNLGRKYGMTGEQSIGHEILGLAPGRTDIPRSDKLIREWVGWNLTWNAMVSRNPTLQLRERMGEIFENHMHNSWEIGDEVLIDQWIKRGTRDPIPFFDTNGLLTQAYYKRLCELKELCDGWFYWKDDISAVVYVSRLDWDAIAAKRPTDLAWRCEGVARGKKG